MSTASKPAEPAASALRERLRRRARMLAAIRAFFDARGALEVDTPCLISDADGAFGADSIGPVRCANGLERHLRTSPEYAMKHLLAAGGGDIYQLGKAFRADESGPLHCPEFAMLEWYRAGADCDALMRETEELLRVLFAEHGPPPPVRQAPWAEIFAPLGFDPRRASDADIAMHCRRAGFDACADRREGLDFLTGVAARAGFAPDALTFVIDYPPAEAQLGQACAGRAERFEVWMGAVELVNGCAELLDADEYLRRAASDNARRRARGRPAVPPARVLLEAMRRGLPPCAGAALGIDRTLACLSGAADIEEVACLPWRAC